MKSNILGMEIVGTANILRRITFQNGYGEYMGEDSPTSMQQWFLSYIWEHDNQGDVFQKDIEETFQVRRSTATEILKAMERKKLIIRTSIAEDKRKKKIMLTDKALEICNKNQEKIMQTEQRIIHGLSEEEINTFLKILGKIQENISND